MSNDIVRNFKKLEQLNVMNNKSKYMNKDGEDLCSLKKSNKIVIGILPGDGIGHVLMNQTVRVLKCVLREEIIQDKIAIHTITGIDESNFSEACNGLSKETLVQIKGCNVILKGPTREAGFKDTLCRYGIKCTVFEQPYDADVNLMSKFRWSYSDPSSLIRRLGMLLEHLGYREEKSRLDKALNICTVTERKEVVTTFIQGASTGEFTDYLLSTLIELEEVSMN